MFSPPEREVAHTFGIQILAFLGGRLNQHWLAESKGRQFVIRRWSPLHAATIDYELRLLNQVAELGWPVAPAIGEPIECQNHFWTLFPFLNGEPPYQKNSPEEQRSRGRLLARFHADLSNLSCFGQRGKWRRCEEILSDQTLDATFSQYEQKYPEEIRVLRWHLDRARTCLEGLDPQSWPSIIVHGDFTPWNLRFQNGQLSGILDFELAHLDHRIADFTLSWRGKYDEVVYGYNEVSPLSPQEWQLLTPLWWAFLLEQAYELLQEEGNVDKWTLTKLLQRSPLMGEDAAGFR